MGATGAYTGSVILDPRAALYEILWEGRWIPVIQVTLDANGNITGALAYDKQNPDTPWGLFSATDGTGAFPTLRVKETH